MMGRNQSCLGFVAVVLGLAVAPADWVRGQGLNVDADGHAALNGKAVFACWNFAAGANLPEDYARYPEFLPFLHGWDFRINLPHVQFQLARPVTGSGAAMVGVEEGGTIATYGHVNNSIWLFQMDSDEGQVYGKVLPSRRDLNGSTTQNVVSLTANWFPVGSSVGAGSPVERPAAAVIGKGIDVARIYLVARDRASELYMTAHTVTGLEALGVEPPVATAGRAVAGGSAGEAPAPQKAGLAASAGGLVGGTILGGGWSEPWLPLGISSQVRPALTEAFDGKLAMAYLDGAGGGLQVRIYTPATSTWGPPTSIDGAGAVPPQLVWDGTALNLFFVGSNSPILQQAYALAADPLTFYARGPVSSLIAVYRDQFHAISFNRRLHVVIRQDNGSPENGPVFYTVSTTDPGRPASWAIPSDTGIVTLSEPRVAWMYENIVAIGTGADGRVRYARKDPNRPGNAETGAALADHWLEAGQDIDPTVEGTFLRLEALTFNSDVYVTANKGFSAAHPAGLYIVNFSRAVLKQLITNKWGMQLLWGGPGGSRLLKAGDFGSPTDIPALGDIDGDGRTDLIRFTQTFSADGQAPVYWHKNLDGDIITPRLLAAVFSLPGEIPMVGDFDSDGKDDIISFTQKPQVNFDGGLIGSAPVWVQLSSGAQGGSQLWHDNFSPAPEVPFVGDFNGDGKDDIVSFAQRAQSNFDGGLIGQAPVWVALSDGSKFGPTQLWHTFFSLAGETPMVGDFNGDGKDDIVTFTQQAQFNADGSLLGHAPVWVALSDGARFGGSSVWHTFFSLAGEVPQVADMNMDGLDDILTFLADKPDTGTAARDSYVAFSLGSRFDRSSVWHSDFVGSNQVRLGPAKRVYSPQIGHLSDRTLGSFTGVAADRQRPVPDIFAFSTDGSVQIATTMGNVPYPAGAPWERYKFFTDKGIGVALFPEWIFEGPGHCIAANHRLAIQGLAGVGGGDLTVSSVRYGGRAPHILEELGHSLFANCFRSSSDPFGLVASIFDVPPEAGGIGANALPGCPDPNGFLSCRPDAPGEHYFLQLLSRYRLNPEFFRDRIAQETDPAAQARLTAQYQWFKQNWFEGQEFATGPSVNASLEQPGVPLLPAALPPIVPDDTVGPAGEDSQSSPNAACGSGAACGAGAPMALLLTMIGLRYRPGARRRARHGN